MKTGLASPMQTELNARSSVAVRAHAISALRYLGACGMIAAAATLSSCGDSSQPDEQATTQQTTADAPGTPPPALPQSELRDLFNSAPNLLAEARTQDVFQRFRAVNQARLTAEGNSLRISATGPSAQVLLPPFIQGKTFVLEATLTSPADGTMRVYYLRRGQSAYTEAQSQTAPLVSGTNVVYFRFDTPDMVDPVRVDLETAPGDYVIQSMVARALPRP